MNVAEEAADYLNIKIGHRFSLFTSCG